VGSGFLFLAHILDCTDGNLARAANRFSPIGKWLDMIGDRISHSFVLVGVSVYFFNSLDSILWTYLALLDAILILNYYYAVDIAIANKLYTTKNTEHRLKLKGVPIRFGLYEPIIYGFVFLAPIGMIKLHIGLIFISVFFGLSFQFYKKLKYAADYGNITP
jgi:phosphatidylglycerophosphate synthase